ncbi:MAG: Mu transposase C-terminal domain-containing protein [Rhizomicrobium sp.]
MHVLGEREWLTATEAASEQLPGLPSSKRNVNRYIAEHEIATRVRSGRGGGREFHWSTMPAAARAEYLKRHGEHTNPVPLGDPAARGCQKDILAEARGLIVSAFAETSKGPKCQARKRFCAAYTARHVKLDPWVFAAVPSVAPHQLALWGSRLGRGDNLRDGRGRPSGSGLFDADLHLRNFVVAMVAARPQLSATHIRRQIAVDLGREIPLRTLQHFLKTFRKTAAPELKALTNPDRYRSHHKPAFGIVGARVERINARWEIDASPADAMCLVNGRELRVKLVGVVDVFTRRAMVLVSDQVRGIATMALLRRAIAAWGMPELLKIDNGKEFKNRAVERFCADAGIATDFSRPFNPEQKPHIERFFGTIARDLFEMLPGYIGHSVAERQGIEARRSFAHRFGEDAQLTFGVSLSPADLQARIDSWCEDVYARRVHAGIACAPHDRALAHAGDVRRLEDGRLLDALLLDAPDAGGIRIVGKSGIRIGNRFYVAGELGEFSGHRVHCRFDPHAPQSIVVYDVARTKFICIARDRDAMADAELAREAERAKKLNAARIRDIRDATRKVQRLYPADGMADRLLIDARGAFVPDPESAEAMRIAARPTLVAQRAALAALETDTEPEQPIEATDAERESAVIFHIEEAQKHEPPPRRMVACDGYERPAFVGDELGLFAWLDVHRDAIDTRDRVTLEEFESDASFQDLLRNSKRAAT